MKRKGRLRKAGSPYVVKGIYGLPVVRRLDKAKLAKIYSGWKSEDLMQRRAALHEAHGRLSDSEFLAAMTALGIPMSIYLRRHVNLIEDEMKIVDNELKRRTL